MQEEKRLNQLKEGSSNGKHRNVLTSESSEGFTLATWVGANDAYVRTAYDQTGNAAGGCCYVERNRGKDKRETNKEIVSKTI
mgnify:CR=1 FL=1